MLERVIVVPLRDNDGKSLSREHQVIRNDLLRIVGGFSILHQRGVWVEGGLTYRDASIRYVVSCSSEQDTTIVQLIPLWAALCRQQAIYTHVTHVDVAFIAPARLRADALASAR